MSTFYKGAMDVIGAFMMACGIGAILWWMGIIHEKSSILGAAAVCALLEFILLFIPDQYNPWFHFGNWLRSLRKGATN